MPPGLKYALAGIQHIEYFDGDHEENLKTILRSLERAGVTIAQPAGARAGRCGEEAAGLPAGAQGTQGAETRRRRVRSPCCPSTTSAPTRRPTTSATG